MSFSSLLEYIFGESFSLIFPILGTNYALSMGSCPIHKDENWHDIIPEEYDVPGLASLDSPPTSRRGGSISISIPEIAFSSIFSETGEFLLYLQECYLLFLREKNLFFFSHLNLFFLCPTSAYVQASAHSSVEGNATQGSKKAGASSEGLGS